METKTARRHLDILCNMCQKQMNIKKKGIWWPSLDLIPGLTSSNKSATLGMLLRKVRKDNPEVDQKQGRREREKKREESERGESEREKEERKRRESASG